MANKKSFNLVGIVAALLAVAGAVINIGHIFENKYIGWALIGAGLLLAIINMWLNLRKYRR